MDFKKIESKENSLIKLISQLQSSAKARKENELFVLEGLRICTDAFENGIKFDKLIICDTALEKYEADILPLYNNSAENIIIKEALFKKISDTVSPQGILAVAKIPDIKNSISKSSGKYIALENIADPANLGAVARTAEALGIDGIIISGSGCDPYSPKSLRASMGTLLRMPLIILNDFSNEIVDLGLTTYACVVDSNAESITNISFESGSIVIIGNEANGITDATKAVSNKLITIPMAGKAESLNASVAAAIAIWEMSKL